MKQIYIIILLTLLSTSVNATGGYDNGTPVGEGKLQLDFTLNPGNIYDGGQSYITWNYGFTNNLGFHGYASHEANGQNQVYYGLKYTFFHIQSLDISTALGLRHRKGETHIFSPQILYTINLAKGFDIGGSIVNVYDISDSENLGVAYDIALRIPFKFDWLQQYVESTKLAIGAFRSVSGNTNPTYSIDVKF